MREEERLRREREIVERERELLEREQQIEAEERLRRERDIAERERRLQAREMELREEPYAKSPDLNDSVDWIGKDKNVRPYRTQKEVDQAHERRMRRTNRYGPCAFGGQANPDGSCDIGPLRKPNRNQSKGKFDFNINLGN